MHERVTRLWPCIGVLFTLAGAAGAEEARSVATAAAIPQGAVDILNANSYLRWTAATRPAAPAEPAGQPNPRGRPARPDLSPNPDDAPPSAGWTAPEFDDSAWPRIRFLVSAWGFQDREGVFGGAFKVFFRGKFTVADPAAVAGLYLEPIRFSGGIRVHLNGREVARAGTQDPDIPPRAAGDAQALGPLRLPPDLLRKGVNVIAVESERGAARNAGPESAPFTLRATGKGIAPNVARPHGLNVWIEDVNDRFCVRDYGDSNESARPMRLVAPRNATAHGTAIVASTGPLRAILVTPPVLKTADGATLPASAVEVLRALPDTGCYGRQNWFDGLDPAIPKELPVIHILRWQQPPEPDAAMLALAVRVRVPKDAAPGDYRGSLSVALAGVKPVEIPVELHAADWTLPNPEDYRTYIGLYQSPTSVSMQYKIPEWSDEHFKKLENSFALLSRVGNKLVNICVVEQTQFGNVEGMVRWVRKEDGTFERDYSVFDRYLALAVRHWKKVDYVALQIWHSGGWETRKADQKNTVTVLDGKTGKRESMQVPVFGTDESKRFWKPVLDECAARLAKLGLEKKMCIGILSDGTAPDEVFRTFDDIWPGGAPARWMRGLHSSIGLGGPYRISRAGGSVVLHEHCYGSPMCMPNEPLSPLWSYRGSPATAYFRYSGFETVVTPFGFRTLSDRALFLRKQGLGRIGFDFWPVMPGKGYEDTGTIYNRYPHSSCAQRAPALFHMSRPGPDGAESTLPYETLCEGVQETEAMLFLSEALDKHAAALGDGLAARCRRVIYDRLWFVLTRPSNAEWSKMYLHVNHSNWQDLARRTFECAGEAARKMGAAKSPPPATK